jgi:hypothetical protein
MSTAQRGWVMRYSNLCNVWIGGLGYRCVPWLSEELSIPELRQWCTSGEDVWGIGLFGKLSFETRLQARKTTSSCGGCGDCDQQFAKFTLPKISSQHDIDSFVFCVGRTWPTF